MFRSVSVVQALVLLIIGVVVGAVLDAAILPAARGMRTGPRQPIRVFTARQRDPEQFRKDSIAAALIARRSNRVGHSAPVEVRRVQALSNCAVSFEFRDSTHRDLKLFDVAAWDRLAPGTVVSRAMTYSETGFRRGDTATVVLPNVYCRDIIIGSFGSTMVPQQSLYWAQ